MESLMAFIWVIIGLVVRFGLPILVTALVIIGLRKLDEIWQSSARTPNLAMQLVQVQNSGCWNAKNCSAETRRNCPAYMHQDMPCWQSMRDNHGQMKEACLGCDVFKSAPVPA